LRSDSVGSSSGDHKNRKEEVVAADSTNKTPTVSGSYYLCIDPSKFGSIADVKARSDAYVSAIADCPPRPGHLVRVPGSKGDAFLIESHPVIAS